MIMTRQSRRKYINMSNLHIKPITLKAANEFVSKYHRHHKSTVGHKFSISCVQDGVVRGGIKE